MKKYFIYTSLLIFVLLLFHRWGNSPISDYRNDNILLQNVEALAQSENGAIQWSCFSESKVKMGYTYYPCSDCYNKIYDEKGIGEKGKCP